MPWLVRGLVMLIGYIVSIAAVGPPMQNSAAADWERRFQFNGRPHGPAVSVSGAENGIILGSITIGCLNIIASGREVRAPHHRSRGSDHRDPRPCLIIRRDVIHAQRSPVAQWANDTPPHGYGLGTTRIPLPRG